jgi:hypothetical protein
MAQSGGIKSPVNPDRELFAGAAGIFLLASNAVSAAILHDIRAGERTLAEISRSLRMEPKAALPRITALLNHGLLVSRSESGATCYRLAETGILQSLDLIRGFSRRKVSARRAKRDSEDLPKKSSTPKRRGTARRKTAPTAHP